MIATRRVVAAGLFVVALVALLSVADSHTARAQDAGDAGVAGASPGPGAVVGGEIDVVQLFYADIITSFDAVLTGPDGEVDGEPVVVSEINAELRLAVPLSEPGAYRVDHTIVTTDGDTVEAAFEFTYVPDAAAPIIVFLDVEDEGGGLHWWGWTLIGVIAAVIVALVIRLVASIRRVQSVSRRRTGR